MYNLDKYLISELRGKRMQVRGNIFSTSGVGDNKDDRD